MRDNVAEMSHPSFSTSPSQNWLVPGQLIFPVVMYGCESWTIKKAEHQSTDAFKLWCWRRLLRVTWTARRSNQWILKEISPEYSLERLMLKLKLQSFGPPDVKNWLIGKDPDAGKDRRQEEKGMTEDEMVGWHHWLNGHEFEQTLGDGEWGETWRAAVHGVAKSWTQLSDWTTTWSNNGSQTHKWEQKTHSAMPSSNCWPWHHGAKQMFVLSL